MVCKKTALYSLASSPERKVPGSKPAEKSLNGVSRVQSEPPIRSSSLGAATKSKEKEKESKTESKCKSLSPAKEATKKYKKRSTISPQKRSSSPAKDVDDGATASKRPKRQAAISAATLNSIYGKELLRSHESESSETNDFLYDLEMFIKTTASASAPKASSTEAPSSRSSLSSKTEASSTSKTSSAVAPSTSPKATTPSSASSLKKSLVRTKKAAWF